MMVRREEGEAVLGHEAGRGTGISVSSVPVSDPKHVPVQAQVTAATSSASCTSSSSADEDFHPQPSLRSKVTTRGRPKRALACGTRLASRFQTQCGPQLQWFPQGDCVSLHLTATAFYLERPKN